MFLTARVTSDSGQTLTERTKTFKVRVKISGTPDFAMNNSGDCSWGFSTLRLDESLLAVGTIAISEAHGVFPDGTQFSIPEDDDPPEPLYVPGDTRTSTVYLAREETESDTKWHLLRRFDNRCRVDEARSLCRNPPDVPAGTH